MVADVQDTSSRPMVWLYVFSISVNWHRLRMELGRRIGDQVCFLTSQYIFPCERKDLECAGPNGFFYRTFHDLLDVEDMEYCDLEADKIVTRESRDRTERVGEYYLTLTRLKNERAAERLLSEFDVRGGVIFCNDLGIDVDVWRRMGLCDETAIVDLPRIGLIQRICKRFREPTYVNFLDLGDERWLLVGRPERVDQYLKRSGMVMRSPGWATQWWLWFQACFLMRMGARSRLWRWTLQIINWPWRVANRRVACLAAAIHSHNASTARLAAALRLEYVNLQDSFLPSYYPSKYLLYRPQVSRFFVWDNFSKGIFKRHGLECAVWEQYRSWRLPKINGQSIASSGFRLLYLASGAGDWTALKNRSDEDLALALLLDVARQRPDVTICYRPHPLWLHPRHQGMNSIERVISCVASTGLTNLIVSQGAQADGRSFSSVGNLSAVSSTVDKDIAWADVVLGEHSQTLLMAAQRGKIIAGLNVAKHTAFISDYIRIGFSLVTNAQELLAIIHRLESHSVREQFLENYNAAIELHNRQNCGKQEHEKFDT